MVWKLVRMEDKRWPNRIMTWSPEGRRRRGRQELTWEKEVKKVKKQGNLTFDDPVRRKIWQLKNSNRWKAGKLLDI